MTDATGISEPDAERSRGLAGVLAQLSFWIGAAGLLSAMAADAISVAGRHLGRPFIGSIEIVQASVVIAASAAMVGATLKGTHAAVHILSENVGPGLRRLLNAFGDLLAGLFFAVLAAGSIWVAFDLRGSYEVSDVLNIPFLPLRIFWCANALLIVALFWLRAVTGDGKKTKP